MKEAIQILNFLDHRGIQLEPVTYNSLLQYALEARPSQRENKSTPTCCQVALSQTST